MKVINIILGILFGGMSIFLVFEKDLVLSGVFLILCNIYLDKTYE